MCSKGSLPGVDKDCKLGSTPAQQPRTERPVRRVRVVLSDGQQPGIRAEATHGRGEPPTWLCSPVGVDAARPPHCRPAGQAILGHSRLTASPGSVKSCSYCLGIYSEYRAWLAGDESYEDVCVQLLSDDGHLPGASVTRCLYSPDPQREMTAHSSRVHPLALRILWRDMLWCAPR